MSKKKHAELATRPPVAEMALRAMVMRREGEAWQTIADRLGLNSTIEAQELAAMAYRAMPAEDVDTLRAAAEDRIDNIIRQATIDLRMAESTQARAQLYRVLLAAERQRSVLLGLDFPKGGAGDG
jgi:hypothetical protein